jgi:hypothetical protein
MGVGGFLVDASLDHKIRVSGFMSIKTSTASRLFDSQADDLEDSNIYQVNS